MNGQDNRFDPLIFLAISKMYSEQSTYLIGSMTREKKMWFNNSIRATDNFIVLAEKDISTLSRDKLQEIVDSMNNGITKLREEMLNVSDRNLKEFEDRVKSVYTKGIFREQYLAFVSICKKAKKK